MRLQQEQTINEQVLKRLLQEQKTTKAVFRLPMTTSQAVVLLKNAYAVEVEHRGHQYINDADTINNINTLASALTSEVPKCGIMLAGSCGNGKTTLVNALKSAIKICSQQGWFGGQQWGLRISDAREISNLMITDSKEFESVKRMPMLAIDDMGKEPAEVIGYGNVYNPVIDLMEYRYNEQLFTIITTNLTPKQVRSKYGNRIADRFNEMMCVMVFTHDTYRK